MTDEQLAQVICSLSLSDHIGDAWEAVEPIMEHLGLDFEDIRCDYDVTDFNNLCATLDAKGILPESYKDRL